MHMLTLNEKVVCVWIYSIIICNLINKLRLFQTTEQQIFLSLDMSKEKGEEGNEQTEADSSLTE